MDLIITPVWSGPSVINIGSQIALGLLIAFFESGKFNTPYSKFSKGGTINMRLAAILVYFSPIVAYTASYIQASSPKSPYHVALLAGFTLHFGKRCLESLFLHKFSRRVGLPVIAVVGFAYTSVAVLAGQLHNAKVPEVYGYAFGPSLLLAGAAVMFFGELLNFYHHYLLAKLRRGQEREYRVPQGGLFRYVACPHYLAEIVAWFGYALMSRHLEMYGVVFIFTCYLAARSRKTSQWYQKNVPGYPADRRSLVPYLF
ncbi:MAG: DUF1295 domain-containing protein [Elusimicrobia bacterium]|nr:DUF1295 domain-containing protein [Elusimicrobiota bacterium]